MRRTTLSLLAACATPCLLLAADHKEAPLISEDLPADINDVYAFLNPNDDSRLVLAMTVNPFTVPAENTNFNFSPNVRHVFHLDYNNDGRADARYFVNFSKVNDGAQKLFVRGSHRIWFSGDVTMPTIEPTPNDPIINDGPRGFTAFAGQRDDPFFFDVVGFGRFLAGTGGFSGDDGFAGFNTSAIVLEAPLSTLGCNVDEVQVWGTTERRRVTLRRGKFGKLEKSFGPWEQIERMGNPAVNTALIPSDKKDFYNIGRPQNDAEDFADDIVASLQSLGTNDENIGILASVALPDTIKLDVTQPVGYPNGRGLDDDVVDTLFFFIFNQTPVSDGAQMNDLAFLSEFPYLAPPHQPE